MRSKLKLPVVLGMSVMLTLTTLTSGYAESGSDLSVEDPPTTIPVEPQGPTVEVGEIESISPSEALSGEQARAVSNSKATQCNRQRVIMSYPEARFTGIKKWCYDGTRVTSATMEVKPFVRPESRYTKNRDGWVYVPKALKKTDRFIRANGVARGAHLSTRTGRFEYRVNGQAKPQAVYIPSITRTAYGTGACKGPKPKDLAPKLVAIYPAKGQKGVPRGNNMVAKLNMEAKKNTANVGTFYAINNKTGEYVDGATGRLTGDLKTILIVPYKPLDANTSYTATIAAGPYGVLGKTGDPLQTGVTWTFTTGKKIANN